MSSVCTWTLQGGRNKWVYHFSCSMKAFNNSQPCWVPRMQITQEQEGRKPIISTLPRQEAKGTQALDAAESFFNSKEGSETQALISLSARRGFGWQLNNNHHSFQGLAKYDRCSMVYPQAHFRTRVEPCWVGQNESILPGILLPTKTAPFLSHQHLVCTGILFLN